MTSIEQVFEELNFPSASRLRRVLDARNIPYNTRELERLVRGGGRHGKRKGLPINLMGKLQQLT